MVDAAVKAVAEEIYQFRASTYADLVTFAQTCSHVNFQRLDNEFDINKLKKWVRKALHNMYTVNSAAKANKSQIWMKQKRGGGLSPTIYYSDATSTCNAGDGDHQDRIDFVSMTLLATSVTVSGHVGTMNALGVPGTTIKRHGK